MASDDARASCNDDGLSIGSEQEEANTKIVDRLLFLARSRDEATVVDMPTSSHVVAAFVNAIIDSDLASALDLDAAGRERLDRIAARLLARAITEEILPLNDDEDQPD